MKQKSKVLKSKFFGSLVFASCIFGAIASVQAENLWTINATGAVNFTGSITGSTATGSISTLTWNTQGYFWTGSIGLTNAQGQLLAVITTAADDQYILSTKGSNALFGKTCSGNATVCVTVIPGQSQSLLSAINSVNGGSGINAGGTLFFLSASDIYSLLGPSAADTLAAMQRNASDLRNIFSLQASYVNPGLSYDCSIFDKNGVCVAFSGRYSSTTSSGAEATSGILTAAYRINPNIRVGGFVEQYATNITSNGVRMSNTNPDFGVFGVWSQTATDEGLKARAAYRYGNHGVTINRDVVGSSEAASGNSDLTTQGAQLTVSNGYRLNKAVLASPYVGLRYISIKRNGYTESASATTTTPLSYDTISQESTSLLLGVNLAAQVASAVSITGSVGVETDTSQKISNYTASGIANLGSTQFNNDTRRTRAVASAGIAYKIEKSQQISAQIFYREEAFGSASTATGMLTYSAGF